MRRHRPFRLIMAGLVISGTSFVAAIAARAGDDAEDVLEDVYDVVEDACPVGGDGVPYNLAAIAREHFTPALRDKLARAYEAGHLDFDVLIDGQDCEIDDIDVDTADEVGGEAAGRVRFLNFGEPRDIHVVLRETGGRWLIDEIAYRHRPWSARRDVR